MNWKYIAAAAGVAYLFRSELLNLVEGQSAAAPAAAAPASSAPAWSAALDSNSTRARLLTAAANDASYKANAGTLTVDQWNYYYSKVRGIPAPGATAIGFAGPDQLVTIDEYWTAMTSSGLGRIRGSR